MLLLLALHRLHWLCLYYIYEGFHHVRGSLEANWLKRWLTFEDDADIHAVQRAASDNGRGF